MIKFIIKTILQFVLILLCVNYIPFTGLSSTGIRLSILNAQGIPFTEETAGNQAGRDGSEWQLYGAISGLAWAGLSIAFSVTYNSGASVWEQRFSIFPIQST